MGNEEIEIKDQRRRWNVYLLGDKGTVVIVDGNDEVCSEMASSSAAGC